MRLGLTLLIGAVACSALQAAQPANGSAEAERLRGRIAVCEVKARRLAEKLAACRAKGEDTALPDAALAVAELFCRFSLADAKSPGMRPAALRSMRYVERMLDDTLRQADQVLAGQRAWPKIPRWNTVGVTWRDGCFWKDGKPVFLSGFNWDASLAEPEPDLARRLGINLVDSSLRGTARRDGALNLDEFTNRQGPYLKRMTERGFAVDALLGVSPPEWMIDSTPGLKRPGYGHYDDYVFEHPCAVAFRRELLDALLPRAARYESLFAIDLANEPAWQQPSDLMLANWRAWLRRKYGTIERLNRAWNAHFASFSEIVRYPSMVSDSKSPWDRADVDFSRPVVRGAHYDWCTFNNERVSAFLRSIAERIKTHAPRVAVHVKIMMGLYFTGSTEQRGWPMRLSYHTFGIDPWRIAEFTDLSGCDYSLTDLSHVEKPNRFHGSVPYVIDWLNAGMAADFLKSLAPDKPLYNSEFHIIEPVDATEIAPSAGDHVRAALWLAGLHGMCANLAWFWGRNPNGTVKEQARPWFKGSLLQQPWALQAWAEETLLMRRFVPEITAFAQQPRPVRLLYSEASAIQDVQYLDCLRDGYEALNFLGVSIGFVTERQLAKTGMAKDARLVIVPNAKYVLDSTPRILRAAHEHGAGVLVIGPESLSRTPTGRNRPPFASAGLTPARLRTPLEYHPLFERALRAAGIRPDLVALDEDGKPAWGVEVRTARAGKKRLAYLVNLLRRPVTVRLRWSVPNVRFHDWRADRVVGERVILAPRQVVFGTF